MVGEERRRRLAFNYLLLQYYYSLASKPSTSPHFLSFFFSAHVFFSFLFFLLKITRPSPTQTNRIATKRLAAKVAAKAVTYTFQFTCMLAAAPV